MKIKEIKIINQDESTEVANIGADAINVDYNDTTVKAELDKLNNDNNTNKSNITNLQTGLSTANSNLALQTSRIDNLAHLDEGSTTGDAELADARVGFNGVTYSNVGNNIRGTDTLLFNMESETSDKITHGQQYFNKAIHGPIGEWCNYTTGKFQSNKYVVGYVHSGFIEVKPSTNYGRTYGEGVAGSVFFDKYKNYISGTQADYFTTPATCKYIVINAQQVTEQTLNNRLNANVLIESDTYYNYVVNGPIPYYEELTYKKSDEINLDYVTVGSDESSDFTNIGQAFTYAINHNKAVLIKPGTYDLISDGITGSGYNLPKKVYGYGATLTCNLQNENWNLSPLNTSYLRGKCEVYGLTIICNNCRYCIHDEMGARSSYYHHVFKDLHLIHNGNKSATLISPNNIGGGTGSGGGLVEIDNCIFEQNGANQLTNVDYHSQFDGNQNKNVIVKCKDSVFNKKFTVTSIGESTSFKNKLYITNCKMGTPNQSQTGTNFDVIAWNNVQ